MIIDGKQIADEIKESLRKSLQTSGKKPAIGIVQAGESEVSTRFIRQKQAFADDIGITVNLLVLPKGIATEELRGRVLEACRENDGVIVQLPLPVHIDSRSVLDAIPREKDVDILSSAAVGRFVIGIEDVFPPVAGAVREILGRCGVDPAGKNAVVVGAGELVGKPSAVWLINRGATVSVLTEKTSDISKYAKGADIIVSGVGKPGLISRDMIKNGAIVIDAGTSVKDNRLLGDVDPLAGERASFITPVPGGVGPITVAMVFRNLLELNSIH